MDSSGNASKSMTRGRKRAAEAEVAKRLEEKQMAKRRQNAFRPRLIPSADDSGDKSILIGPLDLITDPSIPKIQIPCETEEKPEMKEEDQEAARLASGLQNQPSRKDISHQLEAVEERINVKMECDVDSTRIVMEAVEATSPIPLECTRCPDLEKKLEETEKTKEEKDLRIRELEQRNDELSKSLVEVKKKDSNSKNETEDEESLDTDQDDNSDVDTAEEDSTCPILYAILKRKTKKEIRNLMKMGEDWKQKDGKGNSALHLAARTGNTGLVKYFLKLGAEVDARNSAGSTPLMEAVKAKENFSEIVDLLVSRGADLKATNKAGDNALCIALTLRKTAQEIQKVSCGEDKRYRASFEDIVDHDGNTLLHKAAEAGNLEALIYFLSLKPDVNLKNGNGRTPIMSAVLARQNFSSVVDLLLMNGADINACDTILFAIEANKAVKYFKKLVDVGAHWDRDRILFTSLHNGHVEALKYFVRIGANVNAKRKKGTEEWTLVLEAVCREMSEIVDILIKNGAEPLQGKHLSCSTLRKMVGSMNVTIGTFQELSKYGVTLDYLVLHWLAELGNLDALRFCVSNGTDANCKDPHGNTLLFQAATSRKPNLDILDFLVAKGANVNEVDKNGFSVLYRATECSSRASENTLAVLEKLTSLGATWGTGVVGNGRMKESVLHAAVRNGDFDVVEYIISKGVDVDCRDSTGTTPFLLAVKANVEEMPEILRALVKGGADPNARDNDGNTALLVGVGRAEWGSTRLSVDQVKVLIELGCDW